MQTVCLSQTKSSPFVPNPYAKIITHMGKSGEKYAAETKKFSGDGGE